MKKVWIGIGIAVLVALFIGINIYRSAAPTSGSAGQKIQTGGLEEKEISATVMVPGTLKFSNDLTVQEGFGTLYKCFIFLLNGIPPYFFDRSC